MIKSNVASIKRCQTFMDKFKQLTRHMDTMTTGEFEFLASIFEEELAKQKRKHIYLENEV